MTNDEITEYMHTWAANMNDDPSKERSIMSAVIGITVMLAEIAKRMPELNVYASDSEFRSPRFDAYDEAYGWAMKNLNDMSKYYCSFSGRDRKWYWERYRS